MPRSNQDLTELIQFRVPKSAKAAIERAASRDMTSVSEFARRALYRAAKVRPRGKR